MTRSRHGAGDPATAWSLDPEITFLNHGSYGACPRAVLEAQAVWRARLEAEPVRFFEEEYLPALDEARRRVARFVGADPEGLVFVPNATTGVNTVLRALPLGPGDELLTTDHVYPACRNALEETAQACGARLVVAELPLPITGPDDVLEALDRAASDRTRLLLVDHVTSPTAVVFPVARIVAEFRRRGVPVLVDGAHAPGMVDLDVTALGADFCTGNLHKWVCAPKGAGFLVLAPAWRERIRPLVISHGARTRPAGRSRLLAEFDWTGTFDPSAWLAAPAALDFLDRIVEGGVAEVRRRNRALARRARALVAARLGVEPPCPDEMLGSMAALPLPPARELPADGEADPLHRALRARHGIEVPVFPWPAPPRRLVRLSAQLYNRLEQYERLADALATELRRDIGASGGRI